LFQILFHRKAGKAGNVGGSPFSFARSGTAGGRLSFAACVAVCILALWLFPAPAAGQDLSDVTQAKTVSREADNPLPHPGTDDDEQELAPVLRRMESVYGKLESYRAEFRQESETRVLQRRKESTGELFFQKPDQMRWSYRTPEKKDIYLSENQMTIYMPERNTVFLQPLQDALSGAAPARLFLGPAALSETFRISRAEPGTDDPETTCLRLTPRKKGGMSVEEILLWVDNSDFLPRKSRSRDIMGNVTTLHFLQGKTNVKLPGEIFRFQAPPEAEIVENIY